MNILSSTTNKINDEHLFNEPWMENLNQGLLYRYWKKKGSPKILKYKIEGATIYSKKQGEFGVLSVLYQPMFDYDSGQPLIVGPLF